MGSEIAPEVLHFHFLPFPVYSVLSAQTQEQPEAQSDRTFCSAGSFPGFSPLPAEPSSSVLCMGSGSPAPPRAWLTWGACGSAPPQVSSLEKV